MRCISSRLRKPTIGRSKRFMGMASTLLKDGQGGRFLQCCIVRERPDRGKACVTATDRVVSTDLQMIKEIENQTRVEVSQP